MKKNILAIVITSLVLFQGCVPLVIGGTAAGVATGASVIHDRRSTGTILDNKTLLLSLTSKIGNDKTLYDNSHVNVNIYNTTVLLTGEAQSQQIKQQIGNLVLANVPAEIRRVANYITIGEKSSFSNRFYDSKIDSKVKFVLRDINVPTFDSSRVKVVTEHGVVYLMGVLSQTEVNAVVDVASRIKGVNQVVTLFEIDNSITNPKVNFTRDNESTHINNKSIQ